MNNRIVHLAACVGAAGILTLGGCASDGGNGWPGAGRRTFEATGAGGVIKGLKFDPGTPGQTEPALLLELERYRKDYAVVFIGAAAFNGDNPAADFELNQGVAYTAGVYPTLVSWGWPVIITNHVRLGVVGTAAVAQAAVGGDISHERFFLLDTAGANHRISISKNGQLIAAETRPGYFDVKWQDTNNDGVFELSVSFTKMVDATQAIRAEVLQWETRATGLGAPPPQH